MYVCVRACLLVCLCAASAADVRNFISCLSLGEVVPVSTPLSAPSLCFTDDCVCVTRRRWMT